MLVGRHGVVPANVVLTINKGVRMRLSKSLIAVIFVFLSGETTWTQEPRNDIEIFLLPKQARNFTEQRLMALAESYKRGNAYEAASLHRKLAKYYEDNGEIEYAKICKQRADAAEAILND